jgi:hypothetical protein
VREGLKLLGLRGVLFLFTMLFRSATSKRGADK